MEQNKKSPFSLLVRLYKNYGKSRLIFAWSVMALVMGLMIIFKYYPIVRAFSLSVFRTISNERVFVGLDNFGKAFHDRNFSQCITNTFYFIILRVPIGMVFSFILAVGLNKIRQQTLSSTLLGAMFVPTVTSMVAWTLVFKLLYDPALGPLNIALSKIGTITPSWLGDPKWIIPSIALMDIWKYAGYQTLLLYTGLQSIPGEYYDACKVDGCGNWKSFWKITFPLMVPISSMTFIILLINCIQIFVPMYVLFPNLSPGNAASTIGTEIYKQAFKYFNMEYASTLAVIMFFLIFIFTLISIRISRTNWEY